VIDHGPREETPVGLVHPEWVQGRRLWFEPAVAETIRKLHEGDPFRGWAGDPRLAVYWAGDCWELWRLEHDGEYRIVWRGDPGTPLDERIIDVLIEWDRQRQQMSLHDRMVRANERHEGAIYGDWRDYVAGEAAPRLAHAFRKDFDL
jgi:hypothetical protein